MSSTVKVLKTISTLYLIGLAIFTTSIIYSAVQMAADVDADVTDPEGRFLDTPNGTVYQIATNVTLKNSGFYDIDDLKITIGYESQTNSSIKDETVNDIGEIPGGEEKTEFNIQVNISGDTLDTLLIQDDILDIWLKIEAKYVIFGATFEATLEDLEWEGVLNHFWVDVDPVSYTPGPPDQVDINTTIYYNGSLDFDPTTVNITMKDNTTDQELASTIQNEPINVNETFLMTFISNSDLSSVTGVNLEIQLTYTIEGVTFVETFTIPDVSLTP
ncbi:MAG: hypothetical protein ACETVN_01800 [Asgard group archaeon]